MMKMLAKVFRQLRVRFREGLRGCAKSAMQVNATQRMFLLRITTDRIVPVVLLVVSRLRNIGDGQVRDGLEIHTQSLGVTRGLVNK
jgi:hypothetical protein